MADCQQITCCDRENTLSADRFGVTSGGPDEVGFVMSGGAEWSWAAPAATWTAEDGSARSTVEVLAEELGPSLRWATPRR
jgi:hypothetical protein